MANVKGAQSPTRILCVDDEWIVRAGLNHLLAQKPNTEITGMASVEEAVAAIAAGNDYDLIILDLKLPDTKPFAGLSELHQMAPTVPIIVFSVYDTREDVLTAIQHGAMGYLTKATPGQDIKDAVTRVLAGEVWLPRSLLAMDNVQRVGEPRREFVAERTSNVEPTDAASSLTRRQREIFNLLAEGKSNRQIAYDIGISEHTVRVHMTAILRSLGVRNRTQAAVMAAAAQGAQAEHASN